VASNTNACDFFVGRTSTGGRHGVYRCGDEKRLGGAKVTRPSSGTIRYVFSRKAVKNPKRYGWAAAVRSRTGGSIVTHDRMPDYNSFDTYRVR
jgi:hypothetical protein